MNRLQTVLVGVLLIAGLSGGTAPASSREPRVLFFGDSLIAGTGALPQRPVMALTTARDLGWTPVVDAVPGTGYTIGGSRGRAYLSRMKHDHVLASSYDVVVLEGGTNDARHGSLTRLAPAALRVLDLLRRTQPGARVVMVGVFAPPGADLVRYTAADQVLRKVAAQRHLLYISQLGWDGPDFLAVDGYHPSTAGYERMAHSLADALRAP